MEWQKAEERKVLTLHRRDGLQRNVQLKQTFPGDEKRQDLCHIVVVSQKHCVIS